MGQITIRGLSIDLPALDADTELDAVPSLGESAAPDQRFRVLRGSGACSGAQRRHAGYRQDRQGPDRKQRMTGTQVRSVELPAALSDSVSQAATVIPGSGDPVDKVSGAMPSARQAEPSSGGGAGGAVPYLAREPTVSLVQSAVEDALRARGVPDQPPGPEGLWAKIVRLVEGFLHRGNFGPETRTGLSRSRNPCSAIWPRATTRSTRSPPSTRSAARRGSSWSATGVPGCPGRGPWPSTWPKRSPTRWRTGARRT